MYTLHQAAEIGSIDQVENLNSVASSVKPQEIKLARSSSATTKNGRWLRHSATHVTRVSAGSTVDGAIGGASEPPYRAAR
jgi:hypothetical protein